MNNRVYIHLSLPREKREELKKEAEQKGMTLNSYLNLIIAERAK